MYRSRYHHNGFVATHAVIHGVNLRLLIYQGYRVPGPQLFLITNQVLCMYSIKRAALHHH